VRKEKVKRRKREMKKEIQKISGEKKDMKCSGCGKITEVGATCKSVLCEDCTEKDYQEWIRERSEQG
jgi:hypothetical protein